MSTTGAKLPTAVTTASESPWSDNDWTNAANIYGAGEAEVSAATFDAGDQTYILKAYTFDFSAVPTNATIDGVICVINARYATAAASIDLVQLLNTSLSKVGDNKAATPQALTASAADYNFGGAADKWNNVLTDTWVKNSNFGVAVGCLAGGSGNNNVDVYIDSVTLEVYYTEAQNQNIDETASAARKDYLTASDQVSLQDTASVQKKVYVTAGSQVDIQDASSLANFLGAAIGASLVVEETLYDI